MSQLIRRLDSFVRPYYTADNRLWVGLSGGLDSVTLLHALLAAGVPPQRLGAVHVHHGLSANADAWQAFCERLCQRLNIPFSAHSVALVSSGNGIEQDAREARYEVFRRVPDEGDVLLLAHHGNDQAETFFQRLFRGAGLAGLGAMAAARPLRPGVTLLRPWLDTARSELENWAREEQLQWVDDESNADTALERNWWRHDILPAVFRRYPGREKTLLRSVRQLGQDQQVLAQLMAPITDQCLRTEHWPNTAPLVCDLDALAAQHNDYVPYILRDWLNRLNQRIPSADWLERLQREVIHAASDKQPQLKIAAASVRRFHNGLYLVADGPAPGDTHALTLHAGQSVSTPWAGGCLQVQPATRGAGLRPGGYQLVAAAAVRGQRIQPAGRPAKTLKAVFQENAVPVWLRDHWPVLTLNDDLVALPGLTIGADFSVTADKDGSNDDAALMVSWQADSGSHGLWNL